MTTLWDRVADKLDPPDVDTWIPFPKQAIATDLAEEVDELLFGGAAGPGKTEWLCRYGIEQMERWPGNRGLIVRRVYPSLNRTVIPRLKAMLRGRARWNANEHTFTFPNESVLECASLQYADDVLDYQGAEYGWIGFEEITEFLQSQYEFMLGRLRAPADGIRPHVCSTTNPGGPGHSWVKRRFVKPKQDDLEEDDLYPEPMARWRPKADPEVYTPGGPPPGIRVFVPATHADNPKLLERDPGYLSRLRQQSNRGLRLALEKGDWEAIDQVEGALWTSSDIDLGRLSPMLYKKVQRQLRVVAVDPSDGEENGDEYGVCVAALGMDGVGYVEQSYGWKASVRTMAKQTMELYHDLRADAIVVERNHGGKWMIEVMRSEDPTANIVEVWASDGKRTRARPVAALFERREDLGMLFRARIVGMWPELEEELTSTTFGPGELSPNKLDAMVWAISYCCLRNVVIENRGQYQDDRLAGRR